MSIDTEAMDTIHKVASVANAWLLDNSNTALDVDEQGFGDADEYGMYTLSSSVVALWRIVTSSVVVQPNYEQQRFFGIVAGHAAMWQKQNRGNPEVLATDAQFGVHALTMAYLRLYHECIMRRIIVPPTHTNPSKLQ